MLMLLAVAKLSFDLQMLRGRCIWVQDKLTPVPPLSCSQSYAVVPFFKVTERVQLGAATSMGRRDLRGGFQRATAAAQSDGSLRVDITWDEPNAGSICEQWRLVDGGSCLECSSTVGVRAGSVTTRTVYRRSSDGWRPRFQWNPLYNLMGGSS